MSGAAAGDALELVIIRGRSAVCALVGRNHVNTTLEPRSVAVRNVLTRGAVDQHGIGQVIGLHVFDETFDIGRLAALELFAPAGEIDARRPQAHLSGARYAPHAPIEVELTAQAFARGGA